MSDVYNIKFPKETLLKDGTWMMFAEGTVQFQKSGVANVGRGKGSHSSEKSIGVYALDDGIAVIIYPHQNAIFLSQPSQGQAGDVVYRISTGKQMNIETLSGSRTLVIAGVAGRKMQGYRFFISKFGKIVRELKPSTNLYYRKTKACIPEGTELPPPSLLAQANPCISVS